ncbi:MAG: sulfite reductase flavoprotein subunit alpha [Mycobacterium sp.]
MADRPAFALTVGYGTETGNAELLAGQFTTAARAVGIDVTEVDLNNIGVAELAATTHLVVITATSGEGEFPHNAYVFGELLEALDPTSDRLEHLTFAVLSLGDKYYPLFANAGRLADERLEHLGATRLVPRVDCDIDYDVAAAAWTADVIARLVDARTARGQAVQPVTAVDTDADRRHEHPVWNRSNPYTAALSARRLLTAAGSEDEVWHYEIDLTGSGLTYQAGDSIAVHPVNDPQLVEAVLGHLQRDADEFWPGHPQPLGTMLSRHLEIRTPSRALQALVAKRTTDTAAAAALLSDDHTTLDTWLYGRDLLDLLALADLTAGEILDTLRPLQYRDYSIASSPLVHPDQVHLTVAAVRYRRDEREHAGVASAHLADRATAVQIHLQPNSGFRLPAPDVPIIMIGPGTGIAPFRAFLQERQATRATGKSWLFFGHRHRATDYLYGEELENHHRSGVLTRLDLAFSRERAERDYVQHHMLEHADELFGWLQDGAHLYVCGDESRMARDVHLALHQIVGTAGGMDDEAAHDYVNELIKHHRYARDVY